MLQVKETHQLVRYVGLTKNGICESTYDGDLLLFTQPVPLHPFDHQLVKNYYLATEKSSSQGFIDPKDAQGI